MRLFILRHGEAEAAGRTDVDRVLTAKGVRDAQMLGRKLRAESARLDQIIASPYVRTRQTMEHFLNGYDSGIAGVCHDSLASGRRVADVLDLLAQSDGDDHILLISHMPLVSALVAALVTGSESTARQYSMMPAALAELELDICARGAGILHRLIAPPYDR